jgi:hypothetical protein
MINCNPTMNAPHLLAALIGAALLSVPAPTQEHLLRFSFQEGATQYYRQSQEVRMKVDMGGMNMDTTMTMEMTVEFKVHGVKEGTADVSQTVARLVVKMDNPMMGVDYDSDEPDSDAGPMEPMTAMVGKAFKMKIDPTGRVTDFKQPEGFDAPAAGMMGGDLEQFFRSMPELPGKPVAVGATWDTSTNLPMGRMSAAGVKVVNKLVKVEAGKAHMEQVMQVDVAKLELPEGATVKIDRAGGSAVLDLATGLVHQASTEVLMKMTADQGGMKMDMDMTMTTRMTAIDKPAPKKKAADKAADKAGEGASGKQGEQAGAKKGG